MLVVIPMIVSIPVIAPAIPGATVKVVGVCVQVPIVPSIVLNITVAEPVISVLPVGAIPASPDSTGLMGPVGSIPVARTVGPIA